MTDQDKELRRLAEAATPGPWSRLELGSLIVDSGTGSSQNLVATVAMNTYRDRGKYTASFIAAANPAAILSLLARLEAAERDAARLHGIRTLCGFVENGSDTAVKIFQDDATRDWVVKWGKQEARSGSFGTAIDVAVNKESKS